MTSVIAGKIEHFRWKWKISSKDSINTSFPTFISKIKSLGGN